MTATHTPLDSLKWLADVASILEWVSEEVDGINGEHPDLDAVASVATAYCSTIRAELKIHGGATSHYSTGHPVRVTEPTPVAEPRSDGTTEIVIREYVRTAYPDGRVRGIKGDHDDAA